MSRLASCSAVLEVPLAVLLDYCDPTLDDPWGCGRIREEDVWSAIEFDEEISKLPEYDAELFESYSYNVRRIAHFVENGWQDAGTDTEPITVDFGVLGYTPRYLISDGNHRVAAAKFRGDATIQVEVIGDFDKAISVLLQGAWQP